MPRKKSFWKLRRTGKYKQFYNPCVNLEICSGLQNILNRIPYVRAFHLEEAVLHCKHHIVPLVTYPLLGKAKKRGHSDEDPQQGSSKPTGPTKKKPKKQGKTLPSDDLLDRKYGGNNLPPRLRKLFSSFLDKQKEFSENPVLQAECINLLANSLAKRTWKSIARLLHSGTSFQLTRVLKNSHLCRSCAGAVKTQL